MVYVPYDRSPCSRMFRISGYRVTDIHEFRIFFVYIGEAICARFILSNLIPSSVDSFIISFFSDSGDFNITGEEFFVHKVSDHFSSRSMRSTKVIR